MSRAVAIAFVVFALVVPTSPGADASSSSLGIAIDWSMPDRFGIDDDGDGLIDLPNTTEYVHARAGSCPVVCPDPRFEVQLRVTLEGASASDLRSVRWTISGGDLDGALHFVRTGSTLEAHLPEGRYEAEARVTVGVDHGTVVLRNVRTVVVEDILVVAIGDSYASGDGNPEIPRGSNGVATWADPHGPAGPSHAATHRSTVAWPARVALALETGDRHSSVTFVSVAATGDRIDRGILAPGRAADMSQIDAALQMVGERTVDLVLVQAGGNDIGFAHIVAALVDADPEMDPVCYDTMIDQTLAAVDDGDWTRSTSLGFSLPFRWSCREGRSSKGPSLPGLSGLPAALDRLADALDRLSPGRVVIAAYPDPTGDASGICREIVGDTLRPWGFHEVSRAEGLVGVEQVLRPLNALLGEAASRHRWSFVDGVPAAFSGGHGYCAPRPDYGASQWYRNPGRWGGPVLRNSADVSWYRTARDSSTLQGPGAAFETTGTMHPNELGHAAIARLVLAALGGD